MADVARELEDLSLATTAVQCNIAPRPCYPSFYINVDNGGGVPVEPLHDQCKTEYRYSSGEGYEKGTAKHGDRIFQKFHKAISNCPRQIIRYVH